MRLVENVLFAASCLAALCGCGRNHDRAGATDQAFADKSGAPSPGERVGVTTVTGADLGTPGQATERIVAARCTRETACNNVGSDKRFANYEICMRELHGELGDDLQSSGCSRGVDPVALDRCIDAIQAEGCNSLVDTIQRLAACRSSDLCHDWKLR